MVGAGEPPHELHVRVRVRARVRVRVRVRVSSRTVASTADWSSLDAHEKPARLPEAGSMRGCAVKPCPRPSIRSTPSSPVLTTRPSRPTGK